MKTIVVGFIVAILSKILADEGKAWLGWLQKKIRSVAVGKLPSSLQERYDEEWESSLEEIPGDVSKVIYSFGLLRAAGTIRGEFEFPINSTVARMLKRGMDVAMASLILLWVAPVLIVIAIAIRLTSPGPIFYLSDRIGRKGRVFQAIKFRTMTHNADRHLTRFIETKSRDDFTIKLFISALITPIGRFLRKYSLDELPQFINVLKGDMSIVGPRPSIVAAYGRVFDIEVGEYGLDERRCLDVAPGITGLWQVHASGDPSFDAEMDLEYAKDWSIWLDLRILMRSIRVILFWAKDRN